ncbi:MAG: heparin lyase I family protein, partial [Synechococcus sp.]
ISAAALNQYSDELQQWQTALSENADILFYGCNVAAGQKGATFLNQIGELTGADIAASNDLTGHGQLGGNWQLEFSNGQIETRSPFQNSVAQDYKSVLQGKTLFKSGGDSLGNFRRASKTKHGINSVSNPEGSGKAVRFELRRTDPLSQNKHRAEVIPSVERAKFGQDYTYSFRMYFPNDWKADSSFEVVAQWHGTPDRNLGEPYRNPPASLRVSGNSFNLKQAWDADRVTNTKDKSSHGSRTTNLGALKKGEWIDWKFEIKWSYKADGVFRVYRDGKLVFNKTGPNTFNDNLAPYPKIGIYKPDWTARPQKSSTSRRVYYADDYTITTGHGKGASIQSIPEQKPQSPSTGGGGNSGKGGNSGNAGNSGSAANRFSQPQNSDIIRVEAESLQLSNYRVEHNSFASGRKMIGLRGRGSKETGRAVYVHKGSRGTYNLDLKYYDEKDGAGQFQVQLNGKTLDRWTLNGRSNSDTLNAQTLRTRTVRGLTLKAGDRLTIIGTENRGEHARLDALELKPTSQAGSIDRVGQNNSGSNNNHRQTYQAENAKLIGVDTRWAKNRAQGNRYVKFDRSTGDSIEWTIDVPKAGRYRLDWRYSQGDKVSRSPLQLVVNGKTDRYSPKFSSTGGWNNWRLDRDTVYLKKGSNKVRLRASGKTQVNIDSLNVVAV